jgi:hypothetical protein
LVASNDFAGVLIALIADSLDVLLGLLHDGGVDADGLCSLGERLSDFQPRVDGLENMMLGAVFDRSGHDLAGPLNVLIDPFGKLGLGCFD